MRHRVQFAASLSALLLMSVAIVGCANEEAIPPVETRVGAATESIPVTSPTPDATQARQSEWMATVATFPYEMPAGRSFPADVPRYDWPANLESDAGGEVAAYNWWACSVYAAAWDAADAGDTAAANKLFAEIVRAEVADAPGLDSWTEEAPSATDANARWSGQSGLCRQWFKLLVG